MASGFSGITSSGPGVDVGGKNAWGNPLGTGSGGGADFSSALAFLPLATSVMGAGGQYLENISKAKAADYNAFGSEQRMQAIRQASDWNLAMINRRKSKFLSSQKATYAKAGVRMEGSPIEVMVDSATQFELDKISENYNTQVQMAALKSEAQASKMQAARYRFAASFQPSMTLLTGAAKSGMSLGM